MTDKVPKEEPLDLPPPYSLTENEPSDIPHHPTTSPPDYNTIHQQPGYLDPTNTSYIKQEHNGFERITRGKGKQRSECSSSSNGSFEDVRYDPLRGPVGNIFNIAERFVGNAANAANVAIGAPPSSSPAEFGNNIARSATIMANNVSKTAMNYFEQMMQGQASGSSSRSESIRERREERRQHMKERREHIKEKREHIKEKRESSRKGSSYHSEDSSNGSFSPPYQPNTTADCDSNEKLEIKKSNTKLVYEESWSGRECYLKTSNGHLTVQGSLSATESIQLETSNAHVTVDGQILAGKKLSVRTTNGPFIVHGQSIIANEVDIQISNASLHLSSFIQARKINLKTKNGPIIIGNISMGAELYVKSSNAPLEIHIVDIASESAKIEVESSNAPVNVYVPSTFSGYFSIKSNSAGSTSVRAKSIEQSMIEYQTEEKSKKEGICRNFGNKANIEISIKTSNAAATLYI